MCQTVSSVYRYADDPQPLAQIEWLVSIVSRLHSYCELFRKPKLLVDAELNSSAIDDSEDNQDNYEKEVDKIVDGMIAARQKIVHEVANNITQSQARYKRDYDKKRVLTQVSG